MEKKWRGNNLIWYIFNVRKYSTSPYLVVFVNLPYADVPSVTVDYSYFTRLNYGSLGQESVFISNLGHK